MQNPLVLASASPRRHDLLAQLGVDHVQCPTDVDEAARRGESVEDYTARLAEEKARAAAHGRADGIVLGADTVVVLDGETIGKPSSPDEAASHLQRLRGRRHQVITAVAVVDASCDRSWQGHEITDVWIRDFSTQEMNDYIASGDPLDKAGAYAVQSDTFKPVSRIAGSRSNVIGLPLGLTARLLAEAGLEVPITPSESS